MTSTTSHFSQVAIAEDGEVIKQDRRGRVRVSNQRRGALLAEFDGSSMSAAEFARWAGIKYQTFAGWVQKRRRTALIAGHGLREPLSSPPATQFAAVPCRESAVPTLSWIEAQIAEPSHQVPPQEHSAGKPLVLHIPGGAHVRLDDTQSMAELLKALGVGRC